MREGTVKYSISLLLFLQWKHGYDAGGHSTIMYSSVWLYTVAALTRAMCVRVRACVHACVRACVCVCVYVCVCVCCHTLSLQLYAVDSGNFCVWEEGPFTHENRTQLISIRVLSYFPAPSSSHSPSTQSYPKVPFTLSDKQLPTFTQFLLTSFSFTVVCFFSMRLADDRNYPAIMCGKLSNWLCDLLVSSLPVPSLSTATGQCVGS